VKRLIRPRTDGNHGELLLFEAVVELATLDVGSVQDVSDELHASLDAAA
jgi:hypothetical protein